VIAALVDRETHQLHFYKPRLVFGINGGPHPSGQAFMLSGLQRFRDTQILS